MLWAFSPQLIAAACNQSFRFCAVYLKLVMKKPGLDMEMIQSELNLTYKDRCAFQQLFDTPQE